MGGWLEILKLMLPQPNLGWELAELGKKQTGFGKKINEKYSVTFCESIRNHGINSSFVTLTLVGPMTRGISNVLEMSLKNDIIDEIIVEKNDLFKSITGQTKKEEYIYQVLGVKYVEKAEGYRAE